MILEKSQVLYCFRFDCRFHFIAIHVKQKGASVKSDCRRLHWISCNVAREPESFVEEHVMYFWYNADWCISIHVSSRRSTQFYLVSYSKSIACYVIRLWSGQLMKLYLSIFPIEKIHKILKNTTQLYI